jgi:hypothetical protein
MDDQENIREMKQKLKEEEKRLAEEKLEKELKERKDHLERLNVLHRGSKGCKW